MMFSAPLLMAVIMLLFPAGEEPENPWKDKVPAAVKRVEVKGTVSALENAFDVTWRADDWQTSLRLVRRALKEHPDEPKLRGMIVRTLWRAGRIEQAERLATLIPPETDDRVALRALIEIYMARCEYEQAGRWAERLAALGPQTADDLNHLFAARYALQKYDGLAEMLRKAERLVDVGNGYPETYIAESIAGVAAYLDAVGNEPLNQIAQHGSAPLSPLVLLNLPSCDVFINGYGPYRMVIDTGGSIMVALDSEAAEEIGLKSIATASVRGVSGKQETGQALIDELQIGSLTCKRVLTRTFPVRKAVMNAADGIIGTGIFADGRMTLDFANGQLVVSPSSEKPGTGYSVDLRLVSDAKLMTPVKLEGESAMALLDSGADMVVLAPSRLKKIFPDREIQTFDPGIGLGVGSGKTPRISLNPGVELVFADRTYENYSGLGLDVLDTLLSPIIGVQTDILIGMPTFREMKSCTVDYPRCKLWIEWLKRER
ncbi:MAG: aspartyl protease family protein [Phycisphaerae bacterium]|nr:aspartyl protease family protein [Phycisphaerae bacterium]